MGSEDRPKIMKIVVRGEVLRVCPRNEYELEFWRSYESGQWEPETLAILERFIRRQSSYVDVGAWIGPTVLFGAKKASACYAVEPDPVAAMSLKRNVILSELENVMMFDGALSDRCGEVVMGAAIEPGDSMSSMQRTNSKTTWTVPSLTLEAFFTRGRIENCSLLKIDIEGAEEILLVSSVDFLRRIRPSIFLSLHAPFYADPAKTLSDISSAVDFYRHIYDSQGRELNSLEAVTGFAEIVLSDQMW